MTSPDKPVARTSHAEITMDQLGNIQPGLARLMAEISNRYWILYYSAQEGNWKLASLQNSEIKKTLLIGNITRPKYTQHMEAFIQGPLAAIDTAIVNKDWDEFKVAFNKGTLAANAYHKVWDHSEIVWQLPDEPPQHLKLTPLGD